MTPTPWEIARNEAVMRNWCVTSTLVSKLGQDTAARRSHRSPSETVSGRKTERSGGENPHTWPAITRRTSSGSIKDEISVGAAKENNRARYEANAAMLRYSTLCYDMPCHAMLRYDML